MIYIVEYVVWDKVANTWVHKISQEGYDTLTKAEVFCISRGGQRTVQPMVFKCTEHTKFIIHEVYIK